jgi:hypothetical protein
MVHFLCWFIFSARRRARSDEKKKSDTWPYVGCSDVTKQGHESEIHMSLIVAVKQRRARIIRDEICLDGPVSRHNYNIFVQS